MQTFDGLVGKKIIKFLINESGDTIVFVTDSGNIGYQTAGDCCNWVWFNHISGIDALLGNTVNSTEDKEWVNIASRELIVGGDECEEMCFWTIKTNGGYFDIEVRNNHNGYYGGSIINYSVNGLFGLKGFRKVTEDF